MELQSARHQVPLGRQASKPVFFLCSSPFSASAPVWFVYPPGSGSEPSKKSEETFFPFGYDRVVWLKNNFASKITTIPCYINFSPFLHEWSREFEIIFTQEPAGNLAKSQNFSNAAEGIRFFGFVFL